jgi:O-antigen/teichoic acid export membrane protein
LVYTSRAARLAVAATRPVLREQSVFKNVGSNWLVNLLQMAVVLVLAPFVLHRLGPDQNGVWVTIVSFTGILSLLILGIPMASVRFVAEQVARKDPLRMNAAIATCLGICTALGGVALVAGALLWLVFRARYLDGPQASALPPEVVRDASLAFALVALQVAFAFVMRLPYGIFDAYHDFVTRNKIMAAELVLRLGTTIGFLWWRPELTSLAAVQIVSMVFEFAVAMLVLKRRHPDVRIGYAGFDRALVRSIVGFSLFAMLLNVGTLLAFRMDAIVIGMFLPPLRATQFDMGNKFFDPMTSLLIGVGAVVMPMATRLQATGEEPLLRAVFLKWSKICLSIVLLVGIYLVVAGPDFLGWWVGAEFKEPSGRVLQVLMLSFLVYLPVRGVALPVLLGLGRPRAPAIGLLVMGIVNLVISLALVKPLGILGVALGTAIPNVLFALFVLHLACKDLGVPLNEYAAYVTGRTLVGALVPLGALLAFRATVGFDGLPRLVAGGLLLVAVFAVTWSTFVYRGDPHVTLPRLRGVSKPRPGNPS